MTEKETEEQVNARKGLWPYGEWTFEGATIIWRAENLRYSYVVFPSHTLSTLNYWRMR